ncbi:MAG: DoxX-like family protein [Burkholderiales bacterium]|nr:DoxX-like family protein [Burkholderiales bacterium]
MTGLSPTALRQLDYGNTGDPGIWTGATGIAPDSLDRWLTREPSQAQDRLHARLFFLRPLARLTLAILWILSGLVSLTVAGETAQALLATVLPAPWVTPAWIGTGVLDLFIGFALLARPSLRGLGMLQLTVVAAYTLFITFTMPALWADPLGPVLKNLPILVLVLVWMAVEEER